MRHIPTIVRREFVSYFLSPLGYVVMALFMAITGFVFAILFSGAMLQPLDAKDLLQSFFSNVQYVMIFLVPAITMRLLAEERRTGTMEVLLTNPVTDAEVVLGKYLGALLFFLIMLLSTSMHMVAAAIYSDPDWGPVVCSYLALIMNGALMLAIGIFASALTRNQIIAFILAWVAFMVVGMMMGFLGDLFGGPLAGVLKYLSLSEHNRNFWTGVISTRDIVYFLSFTALFLFATVKVVESSRWR